VCTSKAYREFESHSIRKPRKEFALRAGLSFCAKTAGGCGLVVVWSSATPQPPFACPQSGDMAAHGMLASRCGKRDCHDNAVAEGFLATLEFTVVMTRDWHTRDEARRAIFP